MYSNRQKISQTDNHFTFIKQIVVQCQRQSQYLSNEIRSLSTDFQSLHRAIMNKHESCMTEMNLKIGQLQQKIKIYWASVKSMDQIASKGLKQQKDITKQCSIIVEGFNQRVIQLENQL